MKAGVLLITVVTIALLIQETTPRRLSGGWRRVCPQNETLQQNVGACEECTCTSLGDGEKPSVCNMMLVLSGCFCDEKHCRTRDKTKCVYKSECY
uniref:TIL domain containing protein n=1 Tax=Rhipicephalus zambeziensis TaxID=60191 RepID=A0A224YFF8_9ACAR